MHEMAEEWCKYFEKLEGEIGANIFSQILKLISEGPAIVDHVLESPCIMHTKHLNHNFYEWSCHGFRMYSGDEIMLLSFWYIWDSGSIRGIRCLGGPVSISRVISLLMVLEALMIGPVRLVMLLLMIYDGGGT